MKGGVLPAEVAEHIAQVHGVSISDIINAPLYQDPTAYYCVLHLPTGVKVPVSEGVIVHATGPTVYEKYAKPQMVLSLTKAQQDAMTAHVDAYMQKVIEEAGLGKLTGLKMFAANFKPNTDGMVTFKMHGGTPAYDPPLKPAKKGQQISLDI